MTKDASIEIPRSVESLAMGSQESQDDEARARQWAAAVAFIEQHHARITNLHLKDKKKAANGGGNTPWGRGDTPIAAVLKLLQKNKWDIPANVEFEYEGDPLVEVPKCLQYCKEALA